MLTTTEARKFVAECIMDMDENVAFTVGLAHREEDEDGEYLMIEAVIGGCDADFRVWEEDGTIAWEVDTEFQA